MYHQYKFVLWPSLLTGCLVDNRPPTSSSIKFALSFSKLVDNKIANNTLAGMVTICKVINEVADDVAREGSIA